MSPPVVIGVDNPERFLGVNEGGNEIGTNPSYQPLPGVGQAVPDNLSFEQAPENSGKSNKNIRSVYKIRQLCTSYHKTRLK